MKRILVGILIGTTLAFIGCGAKEPVVEEKPQVEEVIEEVNLEEVMEKAYEKVVINHNIVKTLAKSRDWNDIIEIEREVDGSKFTQKYVKVIDKYSKYQDFKNEGLKIFDTEESFKKSYKGYTHIKGEDVYGIESELQLIHTLLEPTKCEILEDGKVILEVAGLDGAGAPGGGLEEEMGSWITKYQFNNVEDLMLIATDDKSAIQLDDEYFLEDEFGKLKNEKENLLEEDFNFRKNNLIKVYENYDWQSEVIDGIIREIEQKDIKE